MSARSRFKPALLLYCMGVSTFCSGCYNGHQDRLAYDALARETIDQDIQTRSGLLRDKLSRLRYDLEAGAGVELSLPSLDTAIADIDAIDALAKEDQGRAQIQQVYYGSRDKKEVPEIQIGDRKDQTEVVSMAGLAVEAHAKRHRVSNAAKDLANAVATFGSEFVKTGGEVIVQQFVPTWLRWVLGISLVVACIGGLVALWQWFKIRFLYTAAVQYDLAYEKAVPKGEREKHAKGFELVKLHSRIQDMRRRQLREESKAARIAMAAGIRRLQTSVPRHQAEDCGDILDPEYNPEDAKEKGVESEDVSDGSGSPSS